MSLDRARSPPRRRGVIGAAGALLAIRLLAAASAAQAAEAGSPSRFRDPQDGWLDLSQFLDTAYGFVPVISPITEPAVGYGAAAALVFVDRKPAEPGQRAGWPNIAVAGGLATENGTDGLFAGHLGNWQEGRLRSRLALADADVNLTFYGLGEGGPLAAQGIGYTIAATGGLVGGSWRFGASPWWTGLDYRYASSQVSRRKPGRVASLLPIEDLDLELAALTPEITYDTRDNFFTPTRGTYLDLSVPVYRQAFGGDRDFETAAVTAIHYRPLGTALFFAGRAELHTSSDGTPFYLRPFVSLRGVPAMRYQGEQTVEAEVELRWQFHPRFSAVGFGGVGGTHTSVHGRTSEQSVSAGGAGFRYLLARTYGLHMGLDLAFGPDDPVIYVVFGSAWMRP